MNTAIADIQAAVMAASMSGNNFMQSGDAADGVSFSDVLALQKGTVGGANIPAGTVTDAAETEEIILPEGAVTVQMTSFEDIAKWLDNADSGMLKGLKILLETALKAMTNSDGKERKTDLFAVLFDSGSSFADGDEKMFLIGSEFMSQVGNVVLLETEADTDPNDILAQLDSMLKKLGGTGTKDDDDEEITLGVMDIIAAMLNGPEEVPEEYLIADMPEAVEAVTEVMVYPKETISSEAPEKIPEMEKLYADYTEEICKEEPAEISENVPHTVKMTFIGLKINNASDQIDTINGDPSKITSGAADEIAIENVVNTADIHYVPDGTDDTEITEEIFPEAPSVREQVIETIANRLFDIKNDNGQEELVMVLRPERLGQVAVKLIKENGAVSVMLSAQHAEVGRMMAERAAELSGSLSDRNVEVKSIEIVEPSNAAEQMGLNFTGQGFERQHEYASGGNSTNYSGAVTADETEISEETEDINIREAKLWTTA